MQLTIGTTTVSGATGKYFCYIKSFRRMLIFNMENSFERKYLETFCFIKTFQTIIVETGAELSQVYQLFHLCATIFIPLPVAYE